ncbi:hypothetical protein K466DRAFT_586538 [Polyporus arcularius HHB13444]|uniref:Uncharacterized protein n=1 Tax=Polyporus arcularius HHB13444 TaxID=1314778 RepID=A0A5C3PBX5_9APHY|nr:hypothetical protein K466DRAFT_586538 [Polyporus arcularius HHB13444]
MDILRYFFLPFDRLKIVFMWLALRSNRIVKRLTRGLWEGELKRLKRNLDERDIELEMTRRQSREAQQSAEGWKKRHVDELGGRVDKAEYDRVVEENIKLQARLGMVDVDATQRSVNFERAMARAEKKQRDLEALLEARSKELQDAQVYVTKLDEVADSEVVRIVEPLNGQIFQAAATLSDAPEFHSDDPREDATAVVEARTRLERSSWLGSNLLDIVGDSTHPEHSVFVQVALQAGLTAYARRIANSWDPSGTKDTTTIENVYWAIRDREPQSVAGRWRSLGRTHLKRILSNIDYAPFLVSNLSDVVADILLVAGATGTRDVIAQIVSAEFESELGEIASLALKFHATTGERVVSRDFALLAAQPGDPFDASCMEAEQGAGESSARVLGTTQLGLVAERSVERDGKRGDLEIRRAVLLKCRVVLQDTADQGQGHSADGAVDSVHEQPDPPQTQTM